MTSATVSAHASGTFRLGDRTVHRLGFGAMRITGDGVWGPPADIARAKEVLHLALELGVDFIDTADSYGPHVSEELIAEALHPYPQNLLIATKGGLLRDGPGQWRADCRPEHLREALEGSLKRLKVDAIDLYQLHTGSDENVPFEDSVGALAQLREQGKIRHVGLSNVTVEQIEQARTIVPIVSVQNRFNLEDRASEGVLDHCERAEIGFIPWFPIATGSLASTQGVLAEVAATHDATHAQIALAWLLARSPVLLPIPGTGSPDHLRENVGAAGIELTREEFERIDRAYSVG